jgi:hypothetical protein
VLAFAELTVHPYATLVEEHNNNVFDVPIGDPANVLGGDPTRADTVRRVLAGATVDYQLSRQKLTFDVEGRRFDYNHFAGLNHNEYLARGEWAWRVTSTLDGTLGASKEQRIVDFADRLSAFKAIENESKLYGTFNVRLTPAWRLETGLLSRDLKSPLVGFPDFGLRETAIRSAAKYNNSAQLVFGLSVTHDYGQFHGAPNVPSFNQNIVEALAEYSIGESSKFNAALGRTRRKDNTTDSATQATTGALGYRRDLTGKTQINLQLQRAVNSYVALAGSELDSGGTFTVVWKPTFKLTFSASYAYTNSKFDAQISPQTGAARSDKLRSVNFDLDYEALRWLAIEPYVRLQKRDSNITVWQFSGTVAGVQLRLKRP